MSHTPDKAWTFGKSPYLTTDEAAEYLRQPTRDAFRKWAQRHGVTLLRRGRTLLVDRRELDRVLQGPGARIRRVAS